MSDSWRGVHIWWDSPFGFTTSVSSTSKCSVALSAQGPLASVVLTLQPWGWGLRLHQDVRNFMLDFSRPFKNPNEGLS